jgi:hypothetical protein
MRTELANKSVRLIPANHERVAPADPPRRHAANGDDQRAQLRLLTVELTSPAGASTTLERSEIQALQTTSFQMTATLSMAGAYVIRAKNPSGDQSDPFSFIVQAEAGGNAPHIDSVSPTSVIHSANLQVFAVTGANFSSALSVTLLDPSGQPLSVNGAIVGTVLPESFQIGVTLTQTGTYTLTVTNPTGETSNSVAIAVF